MRLRAVERAVLLRDEQQVLTEDVKLLPEQALQVLPLFHLGHREGRLHDRFERLAGDTEQHHAPIVPYRARGSAWHGRPGGGGGDQR
jgi:hypothetical protein